MIKKCIFGNEDKNQKKKKNIKKFKSMQFV